MNSLITFPPSFPELRLPRAADKWAATLDEERRRLQEDLETLREREANLRDYEARLREWQAEIDARHMIAAGPRSTGNTARPFHRPTSQSPFGEDSALQLAWEKLHRARELLEAEQTHLRVDRIALRDQQEALKCKEEALARREAKLAEREALVAAATPAAAANGHAGESAVARLTRGPFDIARSVLRGKK